MWLAWRAVPAPAPIGALTVGVTEAGVLLVCFGAGTGAVRAQLAEAGRRLGVPPVEDEVRTEAVAVELADYLAGRRRTFDQPVDWRLTHGDQHVVLSTLYRHVGYGESITYGELAVRSGAYAGAQFTGAPSTGAPSTGAPSTGARPAGRGVGPAARRVGAIMGSNPVPVLVPCHRVLAANGLGGFGGGLPTKRWLLGLEGVLPATLDLGLC